MVAFTLRIYYRLKIRFLKLFVGDDAIALVLFNAIFPWLILEIGGAKVGRNVRVQRWLTIHECGGSFAGLSVGDDVHIGKFVFIDLTAPVTIGNRVSVGMYSKVMTHQNLGDTNMKEMYPKTSGPMVIPDDVVLGAGCMVLYPTRLAAGMLISAGSVVRGNYDKPYILMGNPAAQMPFPPPQVTGAATAAVKKSR